MKKKKTIGKGIYLVIDPSANQQVLLYKLEQAIEQHIVAVQVWDHFNNLEYCGELLGAIINICKQANVPVLINNRWELLLEMDFDGIHFDEIPGNYDLIKHSINREMITGITCNNDLSVVKWANDSGMDYISFCSMFPSTTATSCNLVSFDTVRQLRTVTSLPFFLAGGITPGNIEQLKDLDYSGIAVISGIMSADHPAEAICVYHEKINQHCNENKND